MRPVRLGAVLVVAMACILPAAAAAGPALAEGQRLAYETFPVEGKRLVAVFDDGAQADEARLRYVVTILDATDETVRARIDVGLKMGSDDPRGSHVRYFGRQHVEAAQRGDYSFVRRLDASQLDLANATISPDDSLPGTRPTIEITGEVILTREINATIYLQNGTVCWDDAQGRCGVWALWAPRADASQGPPAPLVSYLPEPTEGAYGAYNASTFPSSARIVSRLSPGLEEWIVWARLGTATGMPGWEDHPMNVTLGNVYDPRDGRLLGLTTREFVDDTLHHAFGLVFYRAVALTPVDLERDAPGFPAWAVAAGVALAFMARKRGRRPA